MTKTGYSCVNLRRKVKHGCVCDIEHWCSANGWIIDPMTCNQKCDKFSTLADRHRPKQQDKKEGWLL